MAVVYRVAAAVTDIAHDTPGPTDVFLVDTNVWCWIAYPRLGLASRPPLPHQSRAYPGYVQRARAAGASLRHVGLQLAEVAHLIERTELDVFNAAGSTAVSVKDFRHGSPTERGLVVRQIQATWSQVQVMSKQLDVVVDDQAMAAWLQLLPSHALDGYDLFLVRAMHAVGITSIITDDGDFCTVPGLHVFTSNNRVIQAARQQNHLVRR